MNKTKVSGKQRKDKKPIGKLSENKVIFFDDTDKVYQPGFYGKLFGDRLELSLVEALFLLKHKKIIIKKNGKKMSFKKFYDYAMGIDERFAERYRVYEDMREKGLLVRTGFKFGCDFRVYERGVNLKRGPKSQKEHTKWTVFCVPEDYTCSFQELSRAVRLAHNIRAKMLWAIVDDEGDCTYYQITREVI
ncbi:MAG: tRNA-intron lyase [Candidatus Aenigmarchaeota archaeon]|nr:tRNA-intron lyase [Candidatus Aenigmarchaeota archaeon]